MRPGFLQSICLALTVALVLSATRAPAHCESLNDAQPSAAHPDPDCVIPFPLASQSTPPSRPILPQADRVERANTSAIGCLIFALPPPFGAEEVKALCFEGEERPGENAPDERVAPAVPPTFGPTRASISSPAVELAMSLALLGSCRPVIPLRC